jgi:hypothetical protein
MSHRIILAALEQAAAGDAQHAVQAWSVHTTSTAARLVLGYALLCVMLDARTDRAARRQGAAMMLRELEHHAPPEPWDGPPLVPDEVLHHLLERLRALDLSTEPLLRWCVPVEPPQREVAAAAGLGAGGMLPGFDRAMLLLTIARCDQPPLLEPLREAFRIAVQDPVPFVRWCLLADIAVIIRPWEGVRAQRMMQGIMDELAAWADPDDRDTFGSALLPDVQVVLGTGVSITLAARVADPFLAVSGLLRLAHQMGEAGHGRDQRSCLAHAVMRLLNAG